MVVVINSPTVNHPAGLRQAQEQLPVEQLITQLSVEALHVTILPRAAPGNEPRTHAGLMKPAHNRLGHELATVIAADMLGSPAYCKQVLQHTNHIGSRERAVGLNGQAFASVFVDDNQQFQLTAVLRPVRDKIVRPDVIHFLGSTANTAVRTVAGKPSSAVLFSRHLHLFLLPEPMDPFAVDLPTVGNQLFVNARKTEARTKTRQTTHLSE